MTVGHVGHRQFGEWKERKLGGGSRGIDGECYDHTACIVYVYAVERIGLIPLSSAFVLFC